MTPPDTAEMFFPRPAAAVDAGQAAQTPFRLRLATLADAPVIARLEPLIFPGEAWSQTSLELEIAGPYRYYLVAVTSALTQDSISNGEYNNGADGGKNVAPGTIVGYGGARLLEHAEILTLGVHPDYRGKGIAQRLLHALIDQAQANKCERVFLEVRESNAPAIHLYKRNGFDALHRIKDYYRTPVEDAILMGRDL